MPRPVAQDFYHAMRFHVQALTSTGADKLAAPTTTGAQAGFTQCTMPELTSSPVNYREGHYIFTRKYPGIYESTDIQMSRGVAKTDSSFWSWLRSAIHGAEEYRVDLVIQHFHKDDYKTLPLTGGVLPALTDPKAVTASRRYIVHEAIPTAHKLGTDFDANSGEVSIMSVTAACEYMDVEVDGSKI